MAFGALLLLVVSGQAVLFKNPEGPIYNGRSGDSSLFRLLPSWGSAPGGECSGTSITGTRGEVVTVTRSSAGFCTKSDGTMVSIAANLPRVSMRSGEPALWTELAATNMLLRSSELDSATWTKAGTAAVTADYAAGPDGTTSADRLVYPATNGSYVLQTLNVGGLSYTMSVYLKGTSTSGVIDFCRGGGAGQCVVCSYNSTSWTRCTHAATYATSSNVFLGCDTGTKGGACSAAGDVLVWGNQGEAGALATSYIATAGTSQTRTLETINGTMLATTTGPLCLAATVEALDGRGREIMNVGGAYGGASTAALYVESGGTLRMDVHNAAAQLKSQQTNAVISTGRNRRKGCVTAAGTITLAVDNVEAASSTIVAVGNGVLGTVGTTLRLGYVATTPVHGYISNICVGPPGACDR